MHVNARQAGVSAGRRKGRNAFFEVCAAIRTGIEPRRRATPPTPTAAPDRTVQAGDCDMDGVGIPADAISGGSIRKADGLALRRYVARRPRPASCRLTRMVVKSASGAPPFSLWSTRHTVRSLTMASFAIARTSCVVVRPSGIRPCVVMPSSFPARSAVTKGIPRGSKSAAGLD